MIKFTPLVGFSLKNQFAQSRWYLLLSFCLLLVTQFSFAQIWTISQCSGLPSTTQSNTYGPMNTVSTANATNRTATIYPSSQLSGISNQILTSIYFHTGVGTSAGMLGTPNLKVYLKEVSNLDWGSGALDWTTASTGATLVFNGNPAPLVGTGGGWKQIPFTANFSYSGTQNLAIFIEYNNPSASNAISWSYEFTSPCVSGSSSGLETKYNNNTTGTFATSLTSTNSRRPYIGFDYVVTCPAPTNIVINNITTSSATATWTPGGSETSWEYATVSAGSPAPTTFTTTNTPNATLSLNPSTNYDFYVKAKCGGTNGDSVLKGPYNFITLCSPMTSMFENFDSYATGSIVPICWDRIIGSTNGNQTISSSTPASGTRNIYQYASSAANGTIVVLPTFSNVNAGTHWLRFKARVSSGTGNLDVGYVTNATDASTFVTLQSLSIGNTSYTVANSEYNVPVPNTVPANARLAIRNYGSPTATIYWDDVYWEPAPTCFPPTNLLVNGTTMNSTTVSWTPPTVTTASTYDLYYSTSSTAPTSLTTPNYAGISGTSQVLNSLTASTIYYVWVRSDCGAGGKSAWTQFNFSTLCGTINGGYSENFDSYTGTTNGNTGVLPNCWNNLGTADGGHISSYLVSSGNSLYMWTSGVRIAFVALPPMSTLQSGLYKLTFDAKASVTAGGILQIGYVDASNTFVELTTFSVPSTGSVYPFSYNVPILPAGITQLALKNLGTPANSLSLDNLSYELHMLSTSEVITKKVNTIYPNPFTDVISITNSDEIRSISVIDLSGRVLKSNIKVSESINLSDLKSGMYLLNLELKDGTKISHKIMKK